MKIIPTFDNVAVLLDQTDQTTKGGIALPGTAKPVNLTGIVHATGSCLTLELEEGDRVLLSEECGRAEFKGAVVPVSDNRTVLVVSSEFILAVIKE